MKRRLDEDSMADEEAEFEAMMQERLRALKAKGDAKASELKELAAQQEKDEYMLKIKRAASRVLGSEAPGASGEGDDASQYDSYN